jgi:hypothetical protein
MAGGGGIDDGDTRFCGEKQRRRRRFQGLWLDCFV